MREHGTAQRQDQEKQTAQGGKACGPSTWSSGPEAAIPPTLRSLWTPDRFGEILLVITLYKSDFPLCRLMGSR